MRSLVGFIIVLISIGAWFFPSDIVKLIIQQKPVLFGLYSQGQFGALFIGTLLLWGIAALFFSKQPFGKAMLGNVVSVLISTLVTLVIVIWGSKLVIPPNYVEQNVEGMAQDPDLNLHGVVRHRPPNEYYHYTYVDKPEQARSYPNAPKGYPPVEIELSSDINGYRNKTAAEHYQILTIGDSFTAGSHVSNHQAWPVLLAEKTAKTVYNMGVSGADPQEYLNNLVYIGLKFKPEIVIVMIYEGNDFRETTFSTKESGAEQGGSFVASLKASPVTTGLRALSQHYFEKINADAPIPAYHELVSWMPLGITTQRNDTEITRYYSFQPKRLDYLNITQEQFLQSENWLATAAILKDMKKVADKNGFQLIIAFAPSKPHVVMEVGRELIPAEELKNFIAYKKKSSIPAEELKQSIYNNLDSQELVLKAFCDAEGIGFVSATKSLKASVAQGIQPYYTYDQHWTPDGNILVSELITEYLGNN